LPPIANKIAKITNPTNKKNLKPWDIFFAAILAKNLSKKYKLIKNNTV
jgi:CRISPR/Cas system endoribonuclease Cas6 (RAMP superfamily)